MKKKQSTKKKIKIPEKKYVYFESSCSLSDFTHLFNESSDNILAVKVNGLSSNLHTKLYKNCCVSLEPIYKRSLAGQAIVRRSLVFLMSMAFSLVDKSKSSWSVDHQLDDGYFCSFRNSSLDVPSGFIKEVKKKMIELQKMEIPITLEKIYYQDAIEYFTKNNMDYTTSLLDLSNDYEVKVNKCDDFMMLNHRVLSSSTSILTEFDIIKRGHGWVLVFNKNASTFLMEFTQKEDERERRVSNSIKTFSMENSLSSRLIKLHKYRNDFVMRTHVKTECVGDINRLIVDKKIERFIYLNNTFQDRIMNIMVKRIVERVDEIRLILIAGPSASGKTTFAKKLRWNLKCSGIGSKTLSVDNYYVTRTESPIDPETGEYDFERIDCLRIKRLNEDLKDLMNGKEIWIPKFNFVTGIPNDKNKRFSLGKKEVLVMEGIHCLNDELTPLVTQERKYKIFIAPFTPINLDDRNYISNKVIRLMRRIVRDKTHRGYTILDTLKQWPSVRKGEHKYIFPHLKNADFIFNSALDYEIGVLKPYIEPLLKDVKPSTPYYDKARELMTFVKNFLEVPYKYVPRDSLLQEFVGGHWLN